MIRSHRARRRLVKGLGLLKMRLQFLRQFLALKATPAPRFSMRWRDRWACFNDATAVTGFDKHYIYHTAWAARVLNEIRPAHHVDIGSSLYFATGTSAFVPIDFYDYRPPELNLSGLNCRRADLSNLPFPSASVESLSCMHVVEHVGLGRYGDPLDYGGDLRAAQELERVVALDGHLLVVVPVGGQARIQFNAHRIYEYKQVLDMFSALTLKEFALIPDVTEGGLIRHASPKLVEVQSYACGCFLFKRSL